MRVFATTLAMVLGLASHAAAEDTPKNLNGVTVVSAQQAKALLRDGSVRIYDVRKKATFVEGHVPSAANAAHAYDDAENRLDMTKLGDTPSTPVLIYSHGPDGWKSYWSAKSAAAAGFTTVYWMRGGMVEWEAERLPMGR